jgi:hypothetical protein
MADKDRQMITKTIKDMSTDELQSTLVQSYKDLSDPEKKEVAKSLGLTEPEPRARNAIWIIAVTAFSTVLVGSFITLAFALFQTQKEGVDNVAKPELIMSVFTAVVGFLAGLFVPSPVQK